MTDPMQYASFNSVQRNGAQDVINEFAKNLINISGKCMDIGCGSGDITNDILLLSLDPNAVIIGTDISKNMIEYAEKKYSDNERLKFEVLDIETKNLPVKFISEFNHIFSFYTLHWCNLRQTFENIYRMLRPGGTILIIFVAAHDSLFQVLKTMAQDDRFAPYMQDYTEKYALSFNDSTKSHKKLEDLLESIGFYIHHCSLRELNIFDSENLLLSVISTFTFLDKMPSVRKEEFKINFVSKYTEKKIQLYSKQGNIKDETVLDRYKILITYAQKKIS